MSPEKTFPSLVHERIWLAQRGRNPYMVTRMQSGWWVLGDHQFLRGYSVLLADPIVESINDLDKDARALFLEDMIAIGDVLLEVLKDKGVYRINYDILGNLDPVLHAHIFPRYLHEVEERRKGSIFRYSMEELCSLPFDEERDGPFADQLKRAAIQRGICHVG